MIPQRWRRRALVPHLDAANLRVVVAIPTIPDRPGLADRTAETWRTLTPGASVDVVVSTAGSSWAAGLNEAFGRAAISPADVIVCGSDDMTPADESWLPAIIPWLMRGCYPAPTVVDPRFTNYGGHRKPVRDGARSHMSTFPILLGAWHPVVFPLPEDLHYFSDNLAAVKLERAGVPCVAVPSCRIIHAHAQEGRGCGYEDEKARLYVDSVRYSRELDRIGINRSRLPRTQRGEMWQEEHLAIGRALGA